jgi:ABC-type molybdate transport system substrate-binding protein
MRNGLSVCLIALFCFLAAPPQALAELKGDVVIFHAGSLTVPLAEMEKRFEALHPGVDIKREAGGSTKMARMISEVGKPADIMASADYKVIDNNLVPDFADINIRFATNQLVLCYTDQSRFAGKINADNWYEILQRDGVVWAIPTRTWTPAAIAASWSSSLRKNSTSSPACSTSSSPRASRNGSGRSPWSWSPCSRPGTWTTPGNTFPWPCSTGSST